MYVTQIKCDECGMRLAEGDSKRDLCKEVKAKGGYAANGIHLCSKHNKETIKKRHLSKKWDWRY